jgi:hypothetical protein
MSSEMVSQIRRQALMRRLAPEHYNREQRKRAIGKSLEKSGKSHAFREKVGSSLENCLSLDA